MAQRIVDDEQYEEFLVKATGDGLEIKNDNGAPVFVSAGAYGPSEANQTRPADTNAYAAGDVVSDSTSTPSPLVFASIGPSGGRIVLQSAEFRTDVNSVASGMGAFRLHLYNTAPSGIVDNAAYNLPSVDRSKYAGYIDFPAPIDLGDTIWSQTEYIGRQIKLASGSTALYGILETRNAFTPTSASARTIAISTLEAGR